jgi:hypothetical protein
VAGEIVWFGSSLSTKLTVARETPLAAATSFNVTRPEPAITALPVVVPRRHRRRRRLLPCSAA